MQIKSSLNPDAISGAVGLLQRHVPDLTPKTLVAAIRGFDEEHDGRQKPTIEKPLSRKQVAELLGVSLVTVDKFIRNGELHAVKIGRHVRIDVESMRQFMENGTQERKEAEA